MLENPKFGELRKQAWDRLKVAVVDADKQNCRAICALLEQANIPVASMNTLKVLADYLKREPVAVLIIDLDTFPVDNTFFRAAF